MNIEILHIHGDYVTTIFTFIASSGGTKFSKTNRRNVKRGNECFPEEVLHVGGEERWHTVSSQKFINEMHLRAAIDRFLPSLIPDFTEANTALEHLQKT